MRLLLDENIPLGPLLVGHSVATVRGLGWVGVQNGLLLDAAENEGFEVLVTADKALYGQQDVRRRQIAVLRLSTSHWQTVRGGVSLILERVDGISPGELRNLLLPRPPRRFDPKS